MKRIIAIVLLAILPLCIVVPALSDTHSALRYRYLLDSDFILQKYAPADFEVFCDMIVCIDTENIGDQPVIDAELTLHDMPENLTHVLLFDGWNIAEGQFDYTSSYSIHVYFWMDDLAEFEQFNRLYLVLLKQTYSYWY